MPPVTINSDTSATLTAGQDNLVLTGTGNINGTGNAGDNEITGNSGNNTLTGNDGNDKLMGNDGNDALRGNNGNDTLIGGTGADNLQGGAGDDRYEIDSSDTIAGENGTSGTDTVVADFSYTLASNLENLTLTGTDNLYAGGNSLSNLLVGNNGNNDLYGGTGNDTLTGGTGDDYLSGEAGNDTYQYSLGDGNDTIYEGNPTDGQTNILQLTGINFSDVTVVGDGQDLLINIPGGGQIRIQQQLSQGGEVPGIHTVQFAGGVTKTSQEMATGITINNAQFATNFGNTLNGTDNGEGIYGGLQSDLINAGGGDDTIYTDYNAFTGQYGTGTVKWSQ
jgi:Ca2+-binding RTX toxin-like protein